MSRNNRRGPDRMTSAEFRQRGLDPQRRQERRTGEHDNQTSFFQILELNGRQFPFLDRIFAIPNAAKRSPLVIKQMLEEGLKAGVPDIFVPIAKRGYGGAWIENKFGDNKMTPAQIGFRDFLLTQNYAFKTCYTLENQLDFTEWYLQIELRRS